MLLHIGFCVVPLQRVWLGQILLSLALGFLGGLLLEVDVPVALLGLHGEL